MTQIKLNISFTFSAVVLFLSTILMISFMDNIIEGAKTLNVNYDHISKTKKETHSSGEISIHNASKPNVSTVPEKYN